MLPPKAMVDKADNVNNAIANFCIANIPFRLVATSLRGTLIKSQRSASAAVEEHGFSRAVRRHYGTGFSPGSRRLKPSFTSLDFAGLKPGASTADSRTV